MGKPRRPRLLIADDNVCDIGGHYFELAQLLMQGADQLGYSGLLATNRRFDKAFAPDLGFEIVPTFRSRRLVRWSLGVDGASRFRRNLQAKSVGGSAVQNGLVNLVDHFRPKRNPRKMLDQWAEDLVQLLRRMGVDSQDRMLINTGDDFAMLALAAAMKRCNLAPIPIDVIFHFALHDGAQPTSTSRCSEFGNQTREAIRALAPHEVRLHATTTPLADQLRKAGLQANDIPYPTRSRKVTGRTGNRPPGQPWKVVLAGLPRAEKGRAAIGELLCLIEEPLLRSGDFRMSMQMPSRRWKRMIPPSLHGVYERAINATTDGPLEIMTNNLAPDDYHKWLDSADLGLFLYNPDRYVARCSGVLLEMMVRGVPVVVPHGCWLADQVNAAGGNGSIGYIYRSLDQIPSLFQRFAEDHLEIRANCNEHAMQIARRHCGTNTLLSMGIAAHRCESDRAA